MRKTEANKEVLAFVLHHGLDKVDNLNLWDYVSDWESLEEDMPLTYARIEKETIKEIKKGMVSGDLIVEEDIDFVKACAFEEIIRKASLKLHEMVWG